MMLHCCSLISFLLIYIFLVFPPRTTLTIPRDKQKDIINQTCSTCAQRSSILNYAFCSESLEAIPVSHLTNLEGLGIISIELALESATNTISTIKKYLSNSSFDQFSIACLNDCLELYSDVTGTLIDTIGAFMMGQHRTANAWLSGVMEAAATCEDGFGQNEGGVSPLTNENYSLFQLCDVALCINNLLSLGCF